MTEGPSEQYFADLKDIEKKLNDNLLKYLKVGDFPETNKDLRMDVYNFVQNWGNKDEEAEDLYKFFNKVIREYSKEFANQLKEKSNIEIIDALIERSDRMDFLIKFMTHAFSYLNFYYIKFKKCPRLEESALKIYREQYFMSFQQEITVEVNKLLKEDRDGRHEHRNKIKKVLYIMKIMDLPNPDLEREKNAIIWINKENPENVNEKAEPPKTPVQDYWYNYFEKDTEHFVVNKAKKDIQNRSTPEYVLEELKFLDEEHERQKELINPIFLERLNAVIYKEIIGKYMVDLVDMDTGVKNMLENNKDGELKNLYSLFKYYEPSLHEISRIFRAYIEKRGNALRSNKEIFKDPKKMVPQLIDLQKEINTLVLDCFKNNGILQKAKNKAFNEFMKSDYYSKQLAYYLDYCMRSGFKGKSQEVVERTLDDIIALFKNLNTKYVFQQETEKKMSDRLIKDSTLSINNEKIFISKLKQESDISLVSKMSGMMSDLETNKKESEAYKNSRSKGQPNGIKFLVQVISNNAWEVGKKHMLDIDLPPLFQTCIDDFEEYYTKKYQEQKLIWHLDFSKLEIQYLYLKNKNISVSTLPQILILLKLEKLGKASIKKIAEEYKCSTEIIKDNIVGLIYNINFNPKCDNSKGVQ